MINITKLLFQIRTLDSNQFSRLKLIKLKILTACTVFSYISTDGYFLVKDYCTSIIPSNRKYLEQISKMG